jgi:hypothetical protein
MWNRLEKTVLVKGASKDSGEEKSEKESELKCILGY